MAWSLMSESIILSACGFIDGTGFGGRSAGHFTHSKQDVSSGGLERNLRWRMVSQVPHDRFGRLDLLSKFAAVAVEMLNLEPPEKGDIRQDMAVVLGTALGCHSVDCEFYGKVVQGAGAGPTLFAYTLPSIAIGEIAMRHQVGGPNYCFMAGKDSGLLALWEGIELIASEEGVRSCICLSIDVSSVEARAITGGTTLAGEMRNHAYAFLVEKKDYTVNHARSPLAEIFRRPASEVKASSGTGALVREVSRLCEFLIHETDDGSLQLASPATLGLDQILDVVRCNL